MVRNNRTLWIFFVIFVAAGTLSLVFEYFFHLMEGDRAFYFIDHYLFGIGGPFFFAPPYSTGGSSFPAPKFLPKIRNFVRRHGFMKLAGNGFWVGIAICETWSIGNEIIVYWIRNPKHGADWGHWASDIAGMLTAYLIYRRLLTLESRHIPTLNCLATAPA